MRGAGPIAGKRIVWVPQRRPTEAESRDIAEHVIARGHSPLLDPCDQIVEGKLAHRILYTAMSRRAHRALDQEVRGAGFFGAPTVILL